MNSFILAHPCFFSSFIYESSVYPSIQPHVSPSFLPFTHPPIHSSISSFLRAISNQLAQIHTTAKTMYVQQYLWFKQLQKMWAVFLLFRSHFSGLPIWTQTWVDPVVLWLRRLPGLWAEPYTWVFADVVIYGLVYRCSFASFWIMTMALTLASLSSLVTVHSQSMLQAPVLMPRGWHKSTYFSLLPYLYTCCSHCPKCCFHDC